MGIQVCIPWFTVRIAGRRFVAREKQPPSVPYRGDPTYVGQEAAWRWELSEAVGGLVARGAAPVGAHGPRSAALPGLGTSLAH